MYKENHEIVLHILRSSKFSKIFWNLCLKITYLPKSLYKYPFKKTSIAFSKQRCKANQWSNRDAKFSSRYFYLFWVVGSAALSGIVISFGLCCWNLALEGMCILQLLSAGDVRQFMLRNWLAPGLLWTDLPHTPALHRRQQDFRRYLLPSWTVFFWRLTEFPTLYMKLSMSFGRLALAGMQWSLPDVLFSALRVTACPPPLSVLGRARPFHGI